MIKSKNEIIAVVGNYTKKVKFLRDFASGCSKNRIRIPRLTFYMCYSFPDFSGVRVEKAWTLPLIYDKRAAEL